MPFSGKVSIRISRKKRDEQDERKAEKFLHWVGNAAYRIQISGVNGSSAMRFDFSLSILDCLMLQYPGLLLKLKPMGIAPFQTFKSPREGKFHVSRILETSK